MFRTPIGFHDAFVAAPSQKAALEAWGSEANLFASGAAEQVDDPELTKAPLERPGEVIKVLRGSAAEQVKALEAAAKSRTKEGPSPRPSPASGRGSRPSRAELDDAEERIEALEGEQRRELRKVEAEIEALERRRRELLRRHEAERDKAVARRDREQAAYDRALRKWEKD